MELIMRKRLKLNLAQLLRLRTAFHTSLLFEHEHTPLRAFFLRSIRQVSFP